jgi:hypothetical protein
LLSKLSVTYIDIHNCRRHILDQLLLGNVVYKIYNKNNYYIYIIYNMPAKMNMVISNGNKLPSQFYSRNAPSTLGAITIKAPTALNASIIGRIHTVKPGCGSCGR